MLLYIIAALQAIGEQQQSERALQKSILEIVQKEPDCLFL